MNGDIQKVMIRIKTAQKRLQAAFSDASWIEDARTFAEKQGVEVKKLLASDLDKVRTFLERERKELERFQKQIPGEVKKFRTFMKVQRKDLEKLLASIGKTSAKKRPAKKKTAKASTQAASRKTTARKKSSTNGKAHPAPTGV